MVWYCQRVLTDGVNRALLPMALGGVAFGLGCAAKWTGIYAGAGLAVLYLGVLYARWQQNRPGFRAEFRTAAVGGVLFYVLLPARPLHWVLFAVLVAQSGVQPQRLVAVPGVDVQLPRDAEGDPPV